MKFKEINLNDDMVFKCSVEYDDNHSYSNTDVSQNVRDKYESVRDVIFDLMLENKLDKTDLAIINTWDNYSKPSMRDASELVGLDKANICRRSQRIKRLIRNAFPA